MNSRTEITKGPFGPDDRLVFMHIPKTGGTTVNAALAKLFDNHEMCPERFSEISVWPKARLNRYRFFSAHAGMEHLCSVPKPYHLVTFLRAPKDRLISAFRFLKSHSEVRSHIPNSFKEFLSADEQWNLYARYLTTGPHDLSKLTQSRCNSDMVSEAMETLNVLTFCGITEHMDKSLTILSTLLDLPGEFISQRLNVTNENPASNSEIFSDPPEIIFDDEVLEALHRCTFLDEAIYKEAYNQLLGPGAPSSIHQCRVGVVGREHAGQQCIWAISSGMTGHLLFGPYCRLLPGNYRATFRLRRDVLDDECAPDHMGEFEVVHSCGEFVILNNSLKKSEFGENRDIPFSISFAVPEVLLEVEFRFNVAEKVRIWVSTQVILQREDSEIALNGVCCPIQTEQLVRHPT